MSAAVSRVRRTSDNGWLVEFEHGLAVFVRRSLASATISTSHPIGAENRAYRPSSPDSCRRLQVAAIGAALADRAPLSAEDYAEDRLGNIYARLTVRLADC